MILNPNKLSYDMKNYINQIILILKWIFLGKSLSKNVFFCSVFIFHDSIQQKNNFENVATN